MNAYNFFKLASKKIQTILVLKHPLPASTTYTSQDSPSISHTIFIQNDIYCLHNYITILPSRNLTLNTQKYIPESVSDIEEGRGGHDRELVAAEVEDLEACAGEDVARQRAQPIARHVEDAQAAQMTELLVCQLGETVTG